MRLAGAKSKVTCRTKVKTWRDKSQAKASEQAAGRKRPSANKDKDTEEQRGTEGEWKVEGEGHSEAQRQKRNKKGIITRNQGKAKKQATQA